MARKGFRPKKRFGQNFLHDPAIARKIIAAAHLTPGQTVVELGAGKGFLTKPLAQTGARVIAVELDRDLFAELEEHFATAPPEEAAAVDLVNEDFTAVSLTGLLAERGVTTCVLIGNIPYHLTREVLFSFLVDEREMIEAAYLMMQREVGERIVAEPGSRTYGIPSVILQSLYETHTLFKVAAGSFVPRPKVDSVVLEFKRLAEPFVAMEEYEGFASVVKSLFQQRRKTIQNSIRAFYSVSEAELRQIRQASEITLEKRPEDLSKEEFLQLARALAGISTVT